jgi:hypothetical protein
MLDPANVPAVAVDETVTRYLMFGKWYRADETIKYEAFMPPDNLELSITRLRAATDSELWEIGRQVAQESNRSLHGRADMPVGAFAVQNLQVRDDPFPGNPNHAKAVGWPTGKSQQMIIAKQIAATPGLRRIPPPANDGRAR